MKAADLIRIMQFGDSVLPVGAFSFSNGVESAVQTGIVHDVPTLKGFVLTALKQAASCDGTTCMQSPARMYSLMVSTARS